MRRIVSIMLVVLLLASLSLAKKRAMTVEDMWAMKRIGDIALSPDGKSIAFAVTQYSMEENKGNSDIWLMSTENGQTQQLTTSDKYDGAPKWRPDGSAIYFLSNRHGSMQIYQLLLAGGEAKKVTDFPVDVEDLAVSPDGSHFAFSANVFADAKTLEASAARDKKRKESKVQARIIDHLFFRAWNRWTDGKRSHVFVCDDKGDHVVDLTPGEHDAPPLDLGGAHDFVFSPKGNELAFVSNHDAMPAASTNNDIFLVPVAGGEATCLTADNEAVDNQPVYSPDGKYIAYRAMKRPGFEADQYEIILYDRNTGERHSLTDSFDRNPGEVVWAPDGKKLYFTIEDQGLNKICSVDIKTGTIKKLVQEHYNTGLAVSPDGKKLYFKRQAVSLPYEIFCADANGKNVQQKSFVNKKLLDQLELNPVENFSFTSFDGKKAHGFILKPPFFDPQKKYPLIYLIHGGPQGMWSDDYHYRWNASMFAAPGYVVAMVNFRGSKGYGQKWCDAVSKNWGNGPYKDLMSGLDYILQNYSFIDSAQVVAAGASYGGFMINWIATHTNRFKALVSHDGVFDQRSMYGATEELWFPEWEFGGTPYEHPALYEKYSPSYYAKNFTKFKTPMLIFHGQHDFRVPVTQAFQLFTALQRYGVPSRLVYFPDETHFVTKPQNAKLWWSEIFSWYNKWLEK